MIAVADDDDVVDVIELEAEVEGPVLKRLPVVGDADAIAVVAVEGGEVFLIVHWFLQSHCSCECSHSRSVVSVWFAYLLKPLINKVII